jgi:VWFA-related protein
MRAIVWAFALVTSSATGLLLAQEQPVESPRETPIQIDVNVVNVPVTITDKQGRFLVDLAKDDFELFENGKKVEIRYFTGGSVQEAKPPLRAGFLIDLSNSARLYYKTYKDSIGDLAYTLLPEGGKNKGFLIGYHTEVDTLVDYTNEPYMLSERMENLKHGGGAAMFDAIYEACTEKLANEKYDGPGDPRKVIVIVGDGHDNASKRTIDEVIYAAQKAQVTIYAVSTVAWGFHNSEEANLIRMADATGGRIARPMDDVHKDVSGYLSKPQDAGNYALTVGTGLYAQAQLQALYKAILAVAGDVQSQYVLGYNPLAPFSDRSYRKIEVKVRLSASADIEVRHRQGYYPPD